MLLDQDSDGRKVWRYQKCNQKSIWAGIWPVGYIGSKLFQERTVINISYITRLLTINQVNKGALGWSDGHWFLRDEQRTPCCNLKYT